MIFSSHLKKHERNVLKINVEILTIENQDRSYTQEGKKYLIHLYICKIYIFMQLHVHNVRVILTSNV